jgi:adenylate cyclase
LLGYPEQAAQRNQEALTLAQELGYPLVLAYGLLYVALFYHLCRDARATQAQAETLITLSSEQGFAYRLAQGRILQGWALAEQGKEVIEQMLQNLTGVQAAGAQIFRPSFLAMLAEVHGRVGQTEEGLVVVSEALADVSKTGERFFEAELYRLKGDLLLQQSADNYPEAEDSFSKALDVARKLEAKSLELRAATSVARLRQNQGKQAEARELLAPVYEWFTEGFDTADLKNAKALLEELSQEI